MNEYERLALAPKFILERSTIDRYLHHESVAVSHTIGVSAFGQSKHWLTIGEYISRTLALSPTIALWNGSGPALHQNQWLMFNELTIADRGGNNPLESRVKWNGDGHSEPRGDGLPPALAEVGRAAFGLAECASRDDQTNRKMEEDIMGVMVLLEAPVKADQVSNMKSYLAELLPDTREYDGCEGMDIYFDTDNSGNMVVVEHWASRPQHEKYLGWRTETGVMDKLGGMLAGPPTIRYFDRADA